VVRCHFLLTSVFLTFSSFLTGDRHRVPTWPAGALEDALAAAAPGQPARRSSRLLAHSASEQSMLSDSMHSSRADLAVCCNGQGMTRGRSQGAMSPPPPRPPHFGSPTGLPSSLTLLPTASQLVLGQAASGALPTSPSGLGLGAQQAQRAESFEGAAHGSSGRGSEGGGADVAMAEASPFDVPATQQAQQPLHAQQGQEQSKEGEVERILHYWEEKDPARWVGVFVRVMTCRPCGDPMQGGLPGVREAAAVATH
jgi:hypothetical protein